MLVCVMSQNLAQKHKDRKCDQRASRELESSRQAQAGCLMMLNSQIQGQRQGYKSKAKAVLSSELMPQPGSTLSGVSNPHTFPSPSLRLELQLYFSTLALAYNSYLGKEAGKGGPFWRTE